MAQIKRIEIQNCLGIKEYEIEAGKINLITGGNERGKTSILEVIEKGLQNTQRRPEFVYNGAEEAFLLIALDDGIEVTRKIKSDGKTVGKVIKDGASVLKPESYLKSLLGEGFGFNPIDFMERKDKEQTEILLSAMPMRVTEENLQEWFGEIPAVDINQHAIDILTYLAEKHFYDRRTLANGEVKECSNEIRTLLEQLPDGYNGDDWREANIGELWEKVQEAQKVNNLRAQARQIVDGQVAALQAIDNRYDLQVKEQSELLDFKIDKAKKSLETNKQTIRDEIEGLKQDITYKETLIAEWEEMIRKARQDIELLKQSISNCQDKLTNVDNQILATKIDALTNEYNIEVKNLENKRSEEKGAIKKRVDAAQKFLAANPEIEVETLQKAAKKAETMKGFISLYDNMRKKQNELIAKQAEANRLDQCVQTARQKPAELLQETGLPIKGLGINKQMQITIDGLPINNLSTSRRIKLALEIARATAGPLKMICVDRFESLDTTQREIFFEEIAGDDYQYWITQVTDGDMVVGTLEGGVS